MASPKKILFLNTSDYGQANVILAAAYALFASEAPVELHVGSEYGLEPEIKQAMTLADETLKKTAPHQIHFHGINGVSQFEAMTRPKTGIVDAWQLPVPNFANCAAFLKCFSYVRNSRVAFMQKRAVFRVLRCTPPFREIREYRNGAKPPGCSYLMAYFTDNRDTSRELCLGNRRRWSTSTIRSSISSRKSTQI